MASGPAHAFHQATGYRRFDPEGPGLDWAARPELRKFYPGRPWFDLPQPSRHPALTLGQAVQTVGAGSRLDQRSLSRLLQGAYGVTGLAGHGPAALALRSAPSAGALYPGEIYLILPDLAGLPAGLYYFDPLSPGLAQLRPGLFGPPAAFFTAVHYRSTWKYRARALRYHHLDVGHLAENLLLAAAVEGWPLELETNLDDAGLAGFLGLDPSRETCLAVAGPPRGWAWLAGLPANGDDSLPLASRVATREATYAPLLDLYAATARPGPADSAFRVEPADLGLNPTPGQPLPPAEWAGTLPLAQAQRQRRSRRNFVPRPLAQADLARLMSLLTLPEPPLIQVGLALADGLYLLDQAARRLALVKPGRLQPALAEACLDQGWLALAGVHVLFLVNLDKLESVLGPRSYRSALLQAGRLAQRVYLAATAQGWGCCGVGAFYDDEAAATLNLGQGGRLLYLVGAGLVKG